jgi:uncharacterized protein YutE (UPF0331/DUF86 family)
MTISAANLERERLLQLAEEYRDQGYEVLFHPTPEDLPGFLKNYRPDMVARREDEAVIVEVKSRTSLRSPSTQYLRNLAEAVAQHSGWRFELVMTNPEDAIDDLPSAESSLQEPEIKSRLQVVKELSTQHPELALLYCWSLVEATLRLAAEHEGLTLQRFDFRYLVKQLATEGVISRSEYQLLMNTLLIRNSIAHGFKTTQLTQGDIDELVNTIEQLLQALHSSKEAD